MSKNTCLPSSLHGPLEHTLFLGCSVEGFSTTVAWGEESSSCTVKLTQDLCAVPPGGNPKVYYDSSLTRRTTMLADPGPYIYGTDGFPAFPPVNAPVYFRCGEFEFSGLIQSIVREGSIGGNPRFTVELTSPSRILKGAQIIIDKYAGSVYNIHNLFNVFGFMDSFGTPCPETPIAGSDAVFGTPAGGYGGANVNTNGMQASQIITGLALLSSAFPRFQNVFSPYGRLVFKGSRVGGYGVMRYDRTDVDILPDFGNPGYPVNENYHDGYLSEYYIDLSALPIPPSYWRVEGTTVGVMELIEGICSDAGCDYFIELIPIKSGSSSIHKIIKVRTVARNAQPRLGRIAEFIGDTEGVESNSIGVEARQEVTESFLVGGFRQIIFQANQAFNEDEDLSDDVIVPYWGKDNDGNAIETIVDDDGRWEFTADCTDLNFTLETPLGANSITLTEGELQAAQNGFTSWMSYIGTIGTPSYEAIQDAFGEVRAVGDISHLLKLQANIARMHPKDFLSINNKSGKFVDDNDIKDLEKIFSFVNTFATDFYGIQFMVRIPYTCKKTDAESGVILTSEMPSPEGGYTRDEEILGLPHPTYLTDFFGEENGLTHCFVRFASASDLDIEHLSVNEYGIYDNNLYVRAEIGEELVFLNDTPRVVISLPQAVQNKISDDEHDALVTANAKLIAYLEGLMKGNEDQAKTVMGKAGGSTMYLGFSLRSATPDGAAVPLKSNIHTYGPWYVDGPPGVTQVKEDGGLVPWNYGGEDVMTLAGASMVNEDVTYMQCGERGSISIPGYPTIPLGAELGATFGAGGLHLIENRSVITNGFTGEHHTDGEQNYTYYSSNIENWEGLYGPNITSIDVQVDAGGMHTRYVMRTYTPAPGRFSRENAQRMAQFGKQRLATQKALRQRQFKSTSVQSRFGRKDKRENHKRASQIGEGSTPHDVLVGYVNDWKDGQRRVTVVTERLEDLAGEIANNYNDKSIMSWDGLIRPVAGPAGSPSLPKYLAGSSGDCKQWGSIPPFSAGGQAYYSGLSNGYSLYPFSTPGFGAGTFDGQPDIGHDIEVIGVGTTVPNSSLVSPIQGYEETIGRHYDTAQRFFALRGPLVIQGWGRDLDGKPIPNESDTEVGASGGTFTNSNLTDNYLDNWLLKPHTWPVGGLDLRWDRTRSVWTIPSYDIVFLEGNAAGYSYTADNGRTLYNAEGGSFSPNNITAPFDITSGANQPTGSYSDLAIAHYHPYKGLTKIYGSQRATMYLGTLQSSITSSSTYATVGSLSPCNGIEPYTGINDLRAVNLFGWESPAGSAALVTWRGGDNPDWVLIQVECSGTG